MAPLTPAAAAELNAAIAREHDQHYLPIANLVRIMRKALPPHAKISDDAKEMMQESVSEYIGFITSEANDRCLNEKRKTITADDIIWAMQRLGFEGYVDPLTHFLERYRDTEGDRRGPSRGPPPISFNPARSYSARAETMRPPVFGVPGFLPERPLVPFGAPMPRGYCVGMYGVDDGSGVPNSSLFQAQPPHGFDPFA